MYRNEITLVSEVVEEFVLVILLFPPQSIDEIGLHVAERSIFLNLARLLWGFDLQLDKDQDGNTIPIDFSIDGLVPGALSNVKPFKCCLFSYCSQLI